MSQRIFTRNAIPIIIIGMMFFVFGFATWINAMLIPYFKIACELSYFQSYWSLSLSISLIWSCRFLHHFPLKKIGFKKGMMLGVWVMAAGAALFFYSCRPDPHVWSFFFAGCFLIGIGLSVLQTAANPYVTILGAKEGRLKESASWVSATRQRASYFRFCSPLPSSGRVTMPCFKAFSTWIPLKKAKYSML